MVWAAFFNFIAFLIFPLAVAKTIGKGIVMPDAITLPVVTAGLMGAIVWNLVTWWGGHSLVVVARARRRLRGRGDGPPRARAPSRRRR